MSSVTRFDHLGEILKIFDNFWGGVNLYLLESKFTLLHWPNINQIILPSGHSHSVQSPSQLAIWLGVLKGPFTQVRIPQLIFAFLHGDRKIPISALTQYTAESADRYV